MPKRSHFASLLLALAVAIPALPAAVQPAGAQVAAMCSSVWVVRPGDTLSRIARACGMSTRDIQRANPRIDWNRLQVGARVSLDGRGAATAPSAPRPADRYVVQRGDTLASIARTLGVSLQAFLAANPGLSERDLQVGRELFFGGGGGGGGTRPVPPRPGNEQGRIGVAIDDSDATPGGSVAFRVTGVQPGARIVVATNPGQGLAGTDAGVRADRRGAAEIVLDLPRNARPGQRWTYEVLNEAMRPLASGSYRIGEPSGGATRPTPGPVRVTGVLSNEGAECPTLRGDDGRLYSIAGNLQGYRAGDRVEVTGEVAQMSVCMQGTTIGLSSIRPAR